MHFIVTAAKYVGAFLLGDAVKSIVNFFSKKGATIAIGVGLFLLLITLLPFEIGLPEDIYNVLVSDSTHDFIRNVSYFFPMAFAFKCLVLLLIVNYTGILTGIVKLIYKIIQGGGNQP